MSSDWIPAVFALAGSALTGLLALAGPRSQRWQTTAQIASADRARREETRTNAYAGFLTAAGNYRAAWWDLLDQQQAGRPPEDLKAAREHVVRCWTQQLHATSLVRVIGPSSVITSLDAAAQAITDLDMYSQKRFDAMASSPQAAATKESRAVNAQGEVAINALHTFAEQARAALEST